MTSIMDYIKKKKLLHQSVNPIKRTPKLASPGQLSVNIRSPSVKDITTIKKIHNVTDKIEMKKPKIQFKLRGEVENNFNELQTRLLVKRKKKIQR